MPTQWSLPRAVNPVSFLGHRFSCFKDLSRSGKVGLSRFLAERSPLCLLFLFLLLYVSRIPCKCTDYFISMSISTSSPSTAPDGPDARRPQRSQIRGYLNRTSGHEMVLRI